MAIFERGDIVNVPLDPVVGHEQRGRRPALALTTNLNRIPLNLSASGHG